MQRQSGSSVEPATSRRSNFDMTPPIPVGKHVYQLGFYRDMHPGNDGRVAEVSPWITRHPRQSNNHVSSNLAPLRRGYRHDGAARGALNPTSPSCLSSVASERAKLYAFLGGPGRPRVSSESRGDKAAPACAPRFEYPTMPFDQVLEGGAYGEGKAVGSAFGRRLCCLWL